MKYSNRKSLNAFVYNIVMLLLLMTVSSSVSAQVKLLSEVKISDEVMFFDGKKVDLNTNTNNPNGYDYVYGNALTPHGDCVKAYKHFVFMTWYRGGKEDRHVMLTRYNMKTGVSKTIEFPHQHTGYNGKWWIGETHNTIAVGICPKDETIHLVYDMHRNGKVQEFIDNDDRLRYTYSIKGGAVVPDSAFTLENAFVNSPKGNYKHTSFHGINDASTTNMLTYPAFFTNDEGDLFLKNRHGYSANGKINFCMYNGTQWQGFTDFNKSNRGGGEVNGSSSTHNWGIYGDMKYFNGKIRIGFQQRLGNKSDKYQYQNGIYYAYSDDPSGKTQWKDYKGVGIPQTFYQPHLIKVAEPGDFVATTQKDQVYMVGGFDWVVTDNEDLHFVSQVKDKQNNVTKKLHTYKSANDYEFTTVQYNAGSELYAAGKDVYVIGLSGGRVQIVKTEGGTSNFQQVYKHTSGPTFDKGVVNVKDGKVYYYLKQAGGSGDKRTTYLQVFDLDLQPADTTRTLGFKNISAGEKIEEGTNLSIEANVGSAYKEVSLWHGTTNLGTLTSAPYRWSGHEVLSNMHEPSYTFKLVAKDENNEETERSISISVVIKPKVDSIISKLIYYYPLEGNVNDFSENANHGTPGAAVSFAPGKYGNAASFSYTEGSYFTTADSVFEYSNPATAYTIAFWLKVSDYSQRGDILQPTNGRTLLYSNGDLDFRCSHQKKTITFSVSENEKNDWLHVALLLDQRDGQRKHQVLINGEQRGGIAENYDFDAEKPQSVGSLIFGSFSAVTLMRNFTGMLDEVCMFNDILTEDEIKFIMNADTIKSNLSQPSSIQNVSASNALQLYPNPTDQELSIVGANVISAEVYNISGKMVERFSVNNNKLEVSSLASGLYILKMKGVKGKSYMSRFIKQ